MLTRPAAPAKRAFERLEQLYTIGGGEGANRVGGTPEEDEAHRLAAGWMAEAGLEVTVDRAGNLVARLQGTRPELAEVWSGSHLDSVPNGGRFDGALGVVAAIEAIEAVGRRTRTLAAVAFRDEERGCHGSRARTAAGELPGAFLELHVEQGPVLERAGSPLGLVSGVFGIARGHVTFEGRAGHAGTTPMDAREDALCEAAEFVLALRAAAREAGGVATVGQVEVRPGAVNVIPAEARLSYDVRAGRDEQIDAVLAVVPGEPDYRTRPLTFGGVAVEALRTQLERVGVDVVELHSGAGHDAAVLAAAGVPSAMLFVRSLGGGASHSPAEESSAEDVALAIDVLAGALGRLGDEP